MTGIAAAAWDRGLYVIVDIHQDGFARTMTRGCGCGFPLWAVSPCAKPHTPDNGCGCKTWAIQELTDPGMHRSFADFYADTYGVRTQYLAMLGRVAGAFAGVTGVIGYDPLNEPWGDERREIAPLYRSAAAALRARHPSAILFLEARGPAAAGFRTRLPDPGHRQCGVRPALLPSPGHRAGRLGRTDRQPSTGRSTGWRRRRRNGARRSCLARSASPVMRGAPATTSTISTTGSMRSSHRGCSGASRPNGRSRIATDGTARTSACSTASAGCGRITGPAPIPAGWPASPSASDSNRRRPPRGCPRLEFAWAHRPELGSTEIVVPAGLFPPRARLESSPSDATCHWDPSGRFLICNAPRAVTVRVVIEVP